MTRKEAVETLKENLCGMCAYGSQCMESCDIRGCDNRDAIKALEQESSCRNPRQVDLISREQAIKEISDEFENEWEEADVNFNHGLNMALSIIKALTSANRPTGHWMVYPLLDEGRVELVCPICEDTFVRAVDYKPHFCENCGARMESDE